MVPPRGKLLKWCFVAQRNEKAPEKVQGIEKSVWNPNVFPPSGWRFTDSDGVLHTAKSSGELVKAVSRYRLGRGVIIGKPWREIQDQLCAAFPASCRRQITGKGTEANKKALKRAKKVRPLPTRVAEWLRSKWFDGNQGKLKWVPALEAQKRAAICAACPKNAPNPPPCKTCGGAKDSTRDVLLAGRAVKGSDKLRACSVFGTDLAVDVLLVRSETPEASQLADAPDNCWKK
jgi:hypothetical protein